MSSLLYQGINVTLVPLSETAWGDWDPGSCFYINVKQRNYCADKQEMTGMLGHVDKDIDALLSSWGEELMLLREPVASLQAST